MYGVMIVDDEASIREYLKNLIPWEDMSLDLVAEAEDSDTAWESYLSRRPKIVITDVNIPYVSGLELARRIKEQDSDVRFIIITGFFDYSTVQASVKLGAADLVSKPVTREELCGSLNKCIQYFEDKIREQKQSETLRSLITENRNMLLEKYISRLLLDSSSKEQLPVLEKLQALQIPVTGRFRVAVFSAGLSDHSDLDSLLMGMKHNTEEVLAENGYSVFAFFNDRFHLVCILNLPDLPKETSLESLLFSVADKLRFYYKANISFGIGKEVDSASLLPSSYQTALRVLDWNIRNPSEMPATYADVEKLSFLPHWNETEPIRQLYSCLLTEDRNKLCGLLEQQFSSFPYHTPIAELRSFSVSFLVSLISSGSSFTSDYSWIIDCSSKLHEIEETTSPDRLKRLLTNAASELILRIRDKEEEGCNELILKAREYILNNLQNPDLSLDSVSRQIGFSSSYFCSLFHKETGISFNEYLNQVRIDKAKELLRDPMNKISEVSRLAGYNTPTHFNYIFKRMVGIPPSEYKNAILKQS